MSKKSDVVVIGGGIIGCAIAYKLAPKYSVTVLESNQLCKEASWAAAGMLAPYAEMFHHLPAQMQQFMFDSAKMYDDFISNLATESKIHIPHRKCGSLITANDYQESKMLSGLLERIKDRDLPFEVIEHEQIEEKQPGISKTIESALFFPRDSHVDARSLSKALVKACYHRGVNFEVGMPVSKINIENRKITSVIAANKKFQADQYVLAAGAWSGGLLQQLEITVPVRPVRGQIIELNTNPVFLNHMLHTSSCYIVPWADGRILIGATMENVGFNKEVTAQGVSQLLDAAIRAVPGIGNASFCNAWAGLRPDTSDNLPIIGKTEIENLLLAAGHFRNGILLAPATSEAIHKHIENKMLPEYMQAFRINRFLSET